MTTLLARVLLTLTFVDIASAQTCTLCPNGEKPRNGHTVVIQAVTNPVTCKELAQEIIDNSNDEFCVDSLVHAFQSVCGCPGIKAGSCPGICNSGQFLAEPDLGTPSDGLTCSVVDQFLRGTPGDTICPGVGGDPKVFCTCKVKVTHGQNMGGGGVGGNEGAGNQGTGMMGMTDGRQRRLGGLEEHFPPRAARGLAM